MEPNIDSFFQDVENIASTLEDKNFKQTVSNIRRNLNSSKLQILIAGNNNSGRFTVVNGIINLTQLLPVSPLPKTNSLIKIVYGEPSVEAVSHDGITVSISEDMKNKILFDTDNSNKFKQVTICAKSDILKICDLTIYPIDANYPEDILKNIFSNTDYALLVTNSTSFISVREKDFISKIIRPYFGFERVAVLLNKIDLVKENERLSIMELAKKYFGSLNTQPLILYYSAANIIENIDKNDTEIQEEDLSLETIKNTLIGNPYELKNKAIQQTAQFCIDEIFRIIEKQESTYSLNIEEFNKMLEGLNLQNSVMQEKIHYSMQKVSFSINHTLKNKYFREIDQFASCLRDKLPYEIKSVEELENVKRYLPGYLEQLWNDFFDYSLPLVRQEIQSLMLDSQKQMMKDLNEISGNILDKHPEFLRAVSIKPANINPWLKHEKSKSGVNKAANMVKATGFVALPLLSLPLGLALIGTGQLINVFGKNSIRESKQQALIDTGINSEIELELRIKKQVEIQFENINSQLMDYIQGLYSERLAIIQETLLESQQNQCNITAKQNQLSDIKINVIPKLQEMISKNIVYGAI